MHPKVSFVIPCYRLAHFLPICLESLLSQTYSDFEVLVMDDCSPDGTGDVVRAFGDDRIRYVRNETNLGHLRNYNKGICSARGDYVWLISADDYLRRPYVLSQYMDVMTANPDVGYVFCSGVGVFNGCETGPIEYSMYSDKDCIVEGHAMLDSLLGANIVLAASGLVRRQCYDRLGMFPLSMPMIGDWYLWCLFALYYKVAYLAEPLVCYRQHALSMTRQLADERLACAMEEMEMLWTLKRKSAEAGFYHMTKRCTHAIAHHAAKHIWFERQPGSVTESFEELEDALLQWCTSTKERRLIRGHIMAEIGHRLQCAGDGAVARDFYVAGLALCPTMVTPRVKWILLTFGSVGEVLWRTHRTLRGRVN